MPILPFSVGFVIFRTVRIVKYRGLGRDGVQIKLASRFAPEEKVGQPGDLLFPPVTAHRDPRRRRLGSCDDGCLGGFSASALTFSAAWNSDSEDRVWSELTSTSSLVTELLLVLASALALSPVSSTLRLMDELELLYRNSCGGIEGEDDGNPSRDCG